MAWRKWSTLLAAVAVSTVANLLSAGFAFPGALAGDRQQPAGPSQVDELIQLVGLNTSYDHYAKHVVAGFASSPAQSSDKNLIAAADVAAKSAFAAEKLKAQLRDDLRDKLAPARLEAVLKFYKGPIGTRMTELENVSMSPEAQADMEQSSEQLKEMLKSDPKRAQILQDLNKALSLTETTLDTSTNLQRAVLIGMATASGQFQQLPMAQIDEIIATGRDKQARRIEELVTLSLAYNYRAARIEDLHDYVAFLASADGQSLYQVVRTVKNRILVAAALEFGEALQKELRKERL